VPGNLRGRSLKPLLEGSGSIRQQAAYAEARYARERLGWSELTSLTSERYLYIKAPREELYDLSRDRGQRANVAGAQPEAVKTLADELARITGARANQAPTAETSTQLTDPKDKPQVIETYRRALELLADRKWAEALAPLQQVTRDAPSAMPVWEQLASAAGVLNRYDVAVDAYHHLGELKPTDPTWGLAAAELLFRERKFEEARAQATAAAEVAPPKDAPARAAAHEMLARIALARRDPNGARDEAALAQQADPARPTAAFVDGRILYDQGNYADALPLFERAMAESRKAAATPVAELHFYAGETMMRLDRREDAQVQFTEEIRYFPQNIRARASLATLYHANGQAEAADGAIADMLRIAPTPESYALGARLWKSFGKPRQAEATRLEARRLFGDGRRSATTSH